MAKSPAGLFNLLLVLLVLTSGKTRVVVNAGEPCDLNLAGSCVKDQECIERCTPCYQGIGKIIAFCFYDIFPIETGRCICRFKNGAPCPQNRSCAKGPPPLNRPINTTTPRKLVQDLA
ncbi:uncharacterized protein LOC130756831 [Actinidia eriantha]|uniref:uncharacterized protein LOC130756831 n=1 Tax=Actinidia eriantha TaxID=165200 RepID=UPI0025871D7C|nr:uncharacterized protein LOC130756831 [Actinidia eriantha]